MSKQVAPIYFNVKEAREYLMKNKQVYTLRHERPTGIAIARQGSYYKWKKLTSVSISKVVELHKEDIESQIREFLPKSGFATVEDWLCKVKWVEPMYLYEVALQIVKEISHKQEVK